MVARPTRFPSGRTGDVPSLFPRRRQIRTPEARFLLAFPPLPSRSFSQTWPPYSVTSFQTKFLVNLPSQRINRELPSVLKQVGLKLAHDSLSASNSSARVASANSPSPLPRPSATVTRQCWFCPLSVSLRLSARTPGHQRRKLPLPLQLPGFRTAPRPCQGTSCAVATILLTLGLNTARAPPPGSRAPLGHVRPVSRVRVACALLRVGSGEESCPAPTLLNAGTLGTGKAWTRKAALLDPCPGAPALRTPEMCPRACGRPRGPHCAEPLPRPRPRPQGGLTHHLPFFMACILARFHPKAGCA